MINIGNKRNVYYAQPGTDLHNYMQKTGKLGSCPNATDMTLLPNPAKVTALEEFLHGSQFRLGIIQDSSQFSYGEAHVKQFMIRHSKMLGLLDADVNFLRELLRQGK